MLFASSFDDSDIRFTIDLADVAADDVDDDAGHEDDGCELIFGVSDDSVVPVVYRLVAI